MQIEFLVKTAFQNANRNGYYYYIMDATEIAYDMTDYTAEIYNEQILEYILNENGGIDSEQFEKLTMTIQQSLKG